jgi:hypothetical protein
MTRGFVLAGMMGALVVAVAGCSESESRESPGSGQVTRAVQVTAGCGISGEALDIQTLTPASIPRLTPLQKQQIVRAVQESAHTDVTTVEQAFSRVDGNEINQIIMRQTQYNQFYVEMEFGAGDNSYGAIFYWGTTAIAAAIHDGDQEECGGLTFNYDRGDTAPECAGFLSYVNNATFQELDFFLPSNVAQGIVNARAVRPFDSVASVVAVNGVAEVRLQQLLFAARDASLVGPTCSGIFDQIATSRNEAAAIMELVNEASFEELHGILGFLINETVISALRVSRPLLSAGAIADVNGVGPAVFRALRNAAMMRRPYEELSDAVNALNNPDAQVRFDRHFEWQALTMNAHDFDDMTCFGIAPAYLPPGARTRAQLANGNEVLENFAEAVQTADYRDELPMSPHPAYADLEHRTQLRTFFGCYIFYHPNPWVYDRITFYVDTVSGMSLLINTHYTE